MAVRSYERKRDGATVYGCSFYGPTGRRRFQIVRVVPVGKGKKEHERARVLAEAAASNNRAAVRNGEWQDPKAMADARTTFKKAVGRFLKEYNSKTGSMTYYQERAAVWNKHFGAKRAADVTPGDVDRFRKAREAAGIGPTTIRQDLTTLSTFFRWAKNRKLVAENPADPDTVKRPPKSKPRPNPLSDEQVVALLDSCPDWLRPVVEFAIHTGADRSEILALNWHRHIKQDRHTINLPRAKTNEARTIPYKCNSTIKRILADAGHVRDTSGTVFLHNGEPILLEAAKTAMRRVWNKLALGPKPWKSLRATFATRLDEAGVTPPQIAALMGVTTAHVFEHYIKPRAKHLEAAMADEAPETGTSDGTSFREAS